MSESEPNPQAVPEPSPASSAADGSVSAASAPSTDTSASKAESTPAEGATKSAEAAASAAGPGCPAGPCSYGRPGWRCTACSGPVRPSPAGSRRAGWHVSPGGCLCSWRARNGSGHDGWTTGYDPAAGYGSAGRPPTGKPAHCCA